MRAARRVSLGLLLPVATVGDDEKALSCPDGDAALACGHLHCAKPPIRQSRPNATAPSKQRAFGYFNLASNPSSQSGKTTVADDQARVKDFSRSPPWRAPGAIIRDRPEMRSESTA